MLHAFSRKHRNLNVKVLGLWLGGLAVLLLELRDIRVTLGLGLLVDPHGPPLRMRRLPGLHLLNEAKCVWLHSCLCFLQTRTSN
jgi:hypothetical protein